MTTKRNAQHQARNAVPAHQSRVAYIQAVLKEAVKWPVERGFTILEDRAISGKEKRVPYPPIFILGPPRSGTTLLMQALAQGFNTCYFTNFIDRFHRSPVVAARVARLFGGCKGTSGFNSYYGRTSHWNDPCDGTKTWLRWFPYEPVYSPLNTLDSKSCSEIQSTVALIERTHDAPFLNKAQRNNGRILELDRIFPDAVFVRIHRDIPRVIQSILYAMRNDLRGHDIWFSMRPSEHAKITTDNLLEHVCEEIFYTEKDIDRDLDIIGRERVCNVHYDALCQSTAEQLQAIASFYHRLSGTQLRKRYRVPAQFTLSTRQYGTEEELAQITQHLAALATGSLPHI